MKYNIPQQWTASQLDARNSKADRYINRVRSRRITTFVQRFFTVSLTFFVVTCVVALLVGAR